MGGELAVLSRRIFGEVGEDGLRVNPWSLFFVEIVRVRGVGVLGKFLVFREDL